MEVRLEEKDIQILDTGARAKPGDRPFDYVQEFDPTMDTDVVEVLIHDENQNFIESGEVDTEDILISKDGVTIKTGVVLRKMGYDRGKYVVKYNFLRNLAGSNKTLLVEENGTPFEPLTTTDANGLQIPNYHIMPDGTIMDGPNHEASENKILRLLEFKYFIQEISSTRREIRILPQEIKDKKYINQFLSLASGQKRVQINNIAKFKSDNLGQPPAEQSLNIELDNGLNVFPQMKGGLIYFNNAFIESEIRQVPFTDADAATRIEELDSENVQSRFVIIGDNGRRFSGEKSLKRIHDFFLPFSENDTFRRTGTGVQVNGEDYNIGGDAIAFFDDRREGTIRQIRWLNKDIFERVMYQVQDGGTEAPVIVTLQSISERPQNIPFTYEWEIFGWNKGGDKYYPLQPRNVDSSGNMPGGGEIFFPSQPNSMKTSGTDLKRVDVHLYGDNIRVGVRLKISSKDGLVSDIYYPACIEGE